MEERLLDIDIALDCFMDKMMEDGYEGTETEMRISVIQRVADLLDLDVEVKDVL